MWNWRRALLLLGLTGWCSSHAATEALAPTPRITSTPVQFTIRICEGTEDLKFWFNDEAMEQWNTCKIPVPEVPVFIVAESGQRSEAKTGTDGIASLPQVDLAPNERFRMAMACSTHRCFSLRDLFVGAPDIRPGANTLYAETVARTDASAK